jgi:hypothetical protein
MNCYSCRRETSEGEYVCDDCKKESREYSAKMEARALLHPCRQCRAEIGAPCLTGSGKPRCAHAKRLTDAERVAKRVRP